MSLCCMSRKEEPLVVEEYYCESMDVYDDDVDPPSYSELFPFGITYSSVSSQCSQSSDDNSFVEHEIHTLAWRQGYRTMTPTSPKHTQHGASENTVSLISML